MAMAGGATGASRDAGAVTYRVRPGVARLYAATGLFMCAVAVIVVALRPANFGKSYFNLLFYVAAVAIATLSLLRSKTCRLTLADDELYFYNGLVDVRRIPLAAVERVEYNPEIRIRIYMRVRGRRTSLHRLPNVFSERDTAEILSRLGSRPGIEVCRIERPGSKASPTSADASGREAGEGSNG